MQSNEKDSRWPSAPNGIVRIEYWINPNNQCCLAEDEVVAATKLSARTWMRANPRIRLVFMGLTDEPPIPLDGKLTIGWATPYAAALVYGRPPPDGVFRDGWHPTLVREMDPVWAATINKPWNYDVLFNPRLNWEWAACSTSCPPYEYQYLHKLDTRDVYDGSPWMCCGYYGAYAEFQSVMTHEFGHVLGLGDLDGFDSCPLTMKTGGCFEWDDPPEGYTTRSQSTLALGDILGLRKLYPFKCPTLRRGHRMPAAYAQVCPTIKIYTP